MVVGGVLVPSMARTRVVSDDRKAGVVEERGGTGERFGASVSEDREKPVSKGTGWAGGLRYRLKRRLD